jgi:phenylalanyl-tRNA synthetase beta chain
MNISFNWLKELIDIDLPVDEAAVRLTDVGLAVESVHPYNDDFILDVDLTSNRPDCLSHVGVARELGVITGKPLKLQDPDGVVPVPVALAGSVVQIEAPDICHRFTARIIKNVKVGPSPKWLVDRLESIGERSINSVADITNYVMHELGQPMHSFDLDKLAENRIVVRRAREGERLMTLKEVEAELDGSVLAICDAEKPVAVGGVVGGLDTSITEKTTNVLLEVAYFRRDSIRATSRRLGLNTEASYRFERGVDIDNIIRASNRATELICELSQGEAGDFIDVYPTPHKPNQVESADLAAVTKRLTGVDVSTGECIRILTALGIQRLPESAIRDPQSAIFISPSWRYDIAIEEDLVEEVARHAGYDKIADELPPAFHAGEYQPHEQREKLLRQTLADIGYDEALSYSFIDTRHDGVFELVPGLIDDKADQTFVELQDSVIEGAVRMRATILPGLLDAVRLNLNYQRRDIKLFEIGTAFAAAAGESDTLPNEQKLFALAVTGGEILDGREMPTRELDLYDAKGAVEAALEAIGIANADCSAAEVKHLRPGQSASISIGGTKVGTLGRLSDDIAATYKFRQLVFVAELNLQKALEMPVSAVSYRPLPKFPAVVRDVSFAAKKVVTFSQIRDSVVEQGFELCRAVGFVDLYEGKGLADDERSITIRLEYRSNERTLLEEEVEAIHQQIVANVSQKLGVKQRL